MPKKPGWKRTELKVSNYQLLLESRRLPAEDVSHVLSVLRKNMSGGDFQRLSSHDNAACIIDRLIEEKGELAHLVKAKQIIEKAKGLKA